MGQFSLWNYTIADFLLIVVISYSLYTDLRTGKIYNHVTFPAMVAGIGLNLWMRGNSGILDALGGLALGYLLLLLPYLIGWQGAGDVKFLMAVGALEGWRFVVAVFLVYLLASFVLSLAFIAARIFSQGRQGRDFLTRLGLAVALGLQVNEPGDREMLRTDIKWSPALFLGTVVALVGLRSFTGS